MTIPQAKAVEPAMTRTAPWCRFWQRRCTKRAEWGEEVVRCDLRRGHRWAHIADRGMFDLVWANR